MNLLFLRNITLLCLTENQSKWQLLQNWPQEITPLIPQDFYPVSFLLFVVLCSFKYFLVSITSYVNYRMFLYVFFYFNKDE